MKKRALHKHLPIFCAIFFFSMLLGIPAIAQSPTTSPPVTIPTKTEATENSKAGVLVAEPKQDSQPVLLEKEILSRRFKYFFELGGQITDVSGERPSKFEENRQVREGFIFPKFRIASNPALSPSFFKLVGRNASERDERYLLDTGQFGKFRTTAEYLRLPNLYTRGARSLLSYSGNGTLTVPDNIQQTLQNAADANLPSLVNGFVAQSRMLDLRLQRATFNFEQTVSLTSHWSVRARFVDIKKYGERPRGTGSYERIGTAIGDTFRVLSIELPEPVDYRTDTMTVGTSYVRERWGVNFDYTYSSFDNRIRSLTFENPFRITDLQATGSGGVFNRMAFAQGILSLPPSNRAHSFLLSGFVDLPRHSRLASALGWSFWRQNEEFVPYTLNSAIVASGIPAETKITETSALPRPSLEGKVDTFTQDHLFATQLFRSVSLNLHYRDYDYDNNTEHILFPGYAAFGESFWRTDISGKPIANEPVSFRKKMASAELLWAVAKPLDWKFEYRWEGWDRENRQVKESNEHTVGTQLSYSPVARFSSRLKYAYSDRTPREYDPGILEFNQLRLFDQAKRLRHNVDFQMQYQLRPGLGISGSIGYLSDDYDQNFFGLSKFVRGYGSLDVLYTPLENTTLYVNYSRERYASVLQSIAKTAAPFDLNNRWNRDERDSVDSFGAGVTTYLAKDKLFLDVHLALAIARNRTNTTNPGTPSANSLINATAFPFPDVKTSFHEFNSDVSYQLTPNVAIGFRYLYEPYRLNDFEWNDLTPYPFNVLAPEHDGRRFLLLDSRYSGYTAHTFGIYLRFSR